MDQPTQIKANRFVDLIVGNHIKVNELILEIRVIKTPLFQPRRGCEPDCIPTQTTTGASLPRQRRFVILTAAGRVGALSALLVKTLALGPAVHG